MIGCFRDSRRPMAIIPVYNTKGFWDAGHPRARTPETKMRIFACTLSSESDYLRPTSVYDTRGSGRKYRQPDIYNPRLVFYGINHIT